jgi:hypothetical protein
MFKTICRDFTPTIELIRQNLGRHRLLILTSATLTQFEEIQSIRNNAISAFERSHAESEAHRRHVVKQWLSSVDCHAQQIHYQKTRAICENAGRWLIEHPQFREWVGSDRCINPLLWLGGIPGAGMLKPNSYFTMKC